MKQFIFFSLLILFCSVNAQDLNEIKSRARAGDASAQYQLACEYLYDEENPTNYIEVLRLLRESSEKGNKDAADLIIDLSAPGYNGWGDYFVEPFYDHGILSDDFINFLYKKAIEGCGSENCKGHKGYLIDIAHSYFNEHKYNKAVEIAELMMSIMSEDNLGKDIGEDENSVVDFSFHEVLMDAFTMLGNCYEHGFGVSKNYKKALAFYSMGDYLKEDEFEAFGLKSILESLHNEHLTSYLKDTEGYVGTGMYVDMVPTMSFKIPMLLLKSGLYQYADVYFKDYDEYLIPDPQWDYTNIAPNMLWYGERFFKGLGVPVDYNKAFKVFYAIVHNFSRRFDLYELHPDVYADACYRLYECYAEGKGVEKNNQKAELYFRQALKFGSSSAIYDSQKYYEASKRDF